MLDTFGAKTYSNIAADETLVDAVTIGTGSQAVLYTYTCYNPNGAAAYVQLFDALAANVTLGTTVPKYVLPLPAGGGVDGGSVVHGIRFTTGICFAVTDSPGGSAAPAVDCVVQFVYQ